MPEPSALPATVVSAEPAERVLSCLVLALAGAAGGGLVAVLCGWLVRLRWLPLPGLLRLVGRQPEPAAALAGVALGLAAGLLLGCLAERDRVGVEVTGEQLTVTRGQSSWRLPRAAVAAVVVDRSGLTALGPDAAQVARIGGDVPADRVVAALRAHGYPACRGGPADRPVRSA